MSEKEYFRIYADAKLHQGILAAKLAGRRHGNRVYSCALAFEIGATILLDLEEKEEEALLQNLADIKNKKTALDCEERLNIEKLNLMKASKEAKLSDASYQNENVQKLAQRIIEIWDSATLFNKRALIGSLVDIDKNHLSRSRLESVFPTRYAPKPSIEDAVKLAIDLLNYEGESVGA